MEDTKVKANTQSFNPGFQVYQKVADLTKLTPVNAFIFCDESMYSLNDGYLQINCGTAEFEDIPASVFGWPE